MRFAGANGAVSLAGSLLLMPFLLGPAHLPLMSANLAAIAACGLANYVLGDLFCFGQAGFRFFAAFMREKTKPGVVRSLRRG